MGGFFGGGGALPGGVRLLASNAVPINANVLAPIIVSDFDFDGLEEGDILRYRVEGRYNGVGGNLLVGFSALTTPLTITPGLINDVGFEVEAMMVIGAATGASRAFGKTNNEQTGTGNDAVNGFSKTSLNEPALVPALSNLTVTLGLSLVIANMFVVGSTLELLRP